MQKEKREQYCRACGQNKGHSFSTCKNVSSLRSIILSQDNETKGYQGEMERMKATVSRVPALETSLALYQRLLDSLLELCELKRNQPR